MEIGLSCLGYLIKTFSEDETLESDHTGYLALRFPKKEELRFCNQLNLRTI